MRNIAFIAFSFIAFISIFGSGCATTQTNHPSRETVLTVTCEGIDCPDTLPESIRNELLSPAHDAVTASTPPPAEMRWSPASKVLAVTAATLGGVAIGGFGGFATGEAARTAPDGASLRDTRLDSALLGGAVVGGIALVTSSAIALITEF
jgi:hypothetical protein